MYPHVLVYWGRKGGGLRLFLELLDQISLSNYRDVCVSVRAGILKEISSKYKNIHFTNIGSPQVDNPFELLCFLTPFRLQMQVNTFKNYFENSYYKSLVVVMSFPGDGVLNKLSNHEVKVTRVIHDIKRHPGDYWPNRYSISNHLKTDRLICLSSYIYNQISHPNKMLSSLSRRNELVKTEEIIGIDQDFILIIGRQKRYKNVKRLKKAMRGFPETKFICAGLGSDVFSSLKNSKVIDRWLSDEEVEFLIMKSRGLIAIYSEASQSGIIDQAVYWKKPVLISNKGALVEQTAATNSGIICDELNLQKIIQGIHQLLDFDNKLIKPQFVEKTLFDTLDLL